MINPTSLHRISLGLGLVGSSCVRICLVFLNLGAVNSWPFTLMRISVFGVSVMNATPCPYTTRLCALSRTQTRTHKLEIEKTRSPTREISITVVTTTTTPAKAYRLVLLPPGKLLMGCVCVCVCLSVPFQPLSSTQFW